MATHTVAAATAAAVTFRGCSNCGLTEEGRKLKKCGRCKRTQYCSRDCQAEHWARHKANCTREVAARKRVARYSLMQELERGVDAFVKRHLKALLLLVRISECLHDAQCKEMRMLVLTGSYDPQFSDIASRLSISGHRVYTYPRLQDHIDKMAGADSLDVRAATSQVVKVPGHEVSFVMIRCTHEADQEENGFIKLIPISVPIAPATNASRRLQQAPSLPSMQFVLDNMNDRLILE